MMTEPQLVESFSLLKKEAITASVFLNDKESLVNLELIVSQKLGVLSRILQVFNRRGLSVEEINFKNDESENKAFVRLKFYANSEQTHLVKNDINKLYDLVNLAIV